MMAFKLTRLPLQLPRPRPLLLLLLLLHLLHLLQLHENGKGDYDFVTKGDNNAVDDRGNYPNGQKWLKKRNVIGRAKGFLPYLGMVTILLNDYNTLCSYAVESLS